MASQELPTVDFTLSRHVSDERLVSEGVFNLLLLCGVQSYLEVGRFAMRRIQTMAIDVAAEGDEDMAFRVLTVPQMFIGPASQEKDEVEHVVMEIQAATIPEEVEVPDEDSYRWQSWIKIIADRTDADKVTLLDARTFASLTPSQVEYAKAVVAHLCDEMQGMQFDDKLNTVHDELAEMSSPRLIAVEKTGDSYMLVNFHERNMVQPLNCGLHDESGPCEHGNPELYN